MVQVRGHHLLCMLTFEGMGYTEAFSRTFREMIDRIGDGEPIEIVDGPDQACRTVLDDPAAPHKHCVLARIKARDRLALTAASAVLGRPLAPGSKLVLTQAMLAALRGAFADGRLRPACKRCQWRDVCTAEARAGFSRSVLRSGARC